MKHCIIVCLVLAAILLSGCMQQGLPSSGAPAGQPGEQPEFTCRTDADCVIDACHGCIPKEFPPMGLCAEQIPPDCICREGRCNPKEGQGQQPGNQLPGGQPGEQPPSGEGQGFRFPPMNTDAPLPEYPANAPKGEWVTKQIGDVEAKYFSTAIIRGASESGADYFIALKNNGNSEATVSFSSDDELRAFVPTWNLHFYSFQDSPIKLSEGEEKKLWFFASLDSGTEEPFTVKFRLWLEGNSGNAIELPVAFGAVEESFWGKGTSVIYGYVKDSDGKPVANAEIHSLMNCGRVDFKEKSDSRGMYAMGVLAMEDIEAIYETRGETGCESNDYFVFAELDGHEYYFNEHVAPTRGEFARLDIVLEKKKGNVSYALKWEKQVEDNYGFFWVKPSADWGVFAATQAKHPPELGKPANFYLFDSEGNILWKQPTGNECWGIDIAPDGSKVAAGCHDEKVYAVDRSGKLLWSFDSGAMVRSTCFSKDGKKVLSGALGTLYLFNSADGTKKGIPWGGQWLRNCTFYQDDTGFIAGARELAGFDSTRNQKWVNIIGEFPLFLGVDSQNNVFAAGKNRTHFSFDSEGKLRWKHRIPDHVVTAGAITPDGGRIAIGTVGGMVYLFDNSGNLLWKRGVGGLGHNAIAISSDGKYVVAGLAQENCVAVYNENGTLLWKGCSEIADVSQDLIPGPNSVGISPDKKEIIAAYGDNYTREFEIKE